MGKFWGIGGGFIRGCLISFCVGIIIAILTYLMFVSIVGDVNTRGESAYSGAWLGWMILLFTTYFVGSAAVLYYGMGYPYDHGYDVGLETCKKNLPVAKPVDSLIFNPDALPHPAYNPNYNPPAYDEFNSEKE